MSIADLNNELSKLAGGKWVKLVDLGDKVVGTLIDAEMKDRTDPDGNVVLGKKSGKPRKIARLRIQTDARDDADDDGVRVFDANEAGQAALREIAPLEIGSLIAVQVTAPAPDKWSQCTYKATAKPAPKVVEIPGAVDDDPFAGLV
jgi:hypothetical protein